MTSVRLPGLLARVPRSHLAAAVVLVLLLLYPVVNPWHPYSQGVMLLGFMLAVQAASWNIISGYAGYTSLGHSMFLGLGSYTVAIIALHNNDFANFWEWYGNPGYPLRPATDAFRMGTNFVVHSMTH